MPAAISQCFTGIQKKMKNILTFDIEEWYDANYPKTGSPVIHSKKSNLENETDKILDLCDKYKNKATFFILGRVASEKPDLVKRIKDRGHEIASHGFGHDLVYKMSPQQFKEDLKRSIGILEDITGKKIFGYRAP